MTGINPSAIPGAGLDPDAVVAAANAMATGGGSVRDTGADIVGKWRGLGAHYQAPEAAQLFTVMDPVEAGAREFGDAVEQVAVVLRAYAEEVRPIQAALASVRNDAYAFTHKIASNSDWQYDQGLVDENTHLIKRVNAAQIKLWDAERTCANNIRALYCAAPWHAATSDKDPLGYGVSQLPTDAKMPWGSSVDRKDHCPKAAAVGVKRFVWDGVVVDGLWGTVVGLGALIGIKDWSWSTTNFTDSWKAMGALIGYSAADGSWSWGNAGNGWKGLGKGLVSWDTWKDDPGRAAGGAVFNIATLVIPGADAVTGLKAAGTAAETTKAAALLSKGAKLLEFTDPISLTIKASKIAIPKLGDLLGGLSDAGKGLDNVVHDVPTGLDAPHGVDTPPVRDPDHVPVHEPVHEPAPELVGPDGIHPGHDAPGGTGTGGDDPANPGSGANPHDPGSPADGPSHADGPSNGAPSSPGAGHEAGSGDPDAKGPGGFGSDDPPASTGDATAPPAPGGEPGRIAIDETGAPHVVNFSDQLLGTKGAMEAHLQAVLEFHHVSGAEFGNLLKTPLENLSRADVEKFIAIDQDTGGVLDDTPLQKIIPPGQALQILDEAAPRFAEPELLARVTAASGDDILKNLSGFVSRGQDVVGLTPTEIFHDLGLNYTRTPFVDSGESVFAVRYRAGDLSAMPVVPDGPLRAMQSMPDSIYEISNDAARRSAMIDWVNTHDPSSAYHAANAFDPTNPFRGNGWGGTGDAFSPELTYGTTKVGIPTGAELWRILPDGSQEIAAVFREGDWKVVVEQPLGAP